MYHLIKYIFYIFLKKVIKTSEKQENINEETDQQSNEE